MAIVLLIVDDEEEIRTMLERHFMLLDYDVETAGNGKEAVAILEEKRIDIVVTDLMMPEMNGIELLRYIKEETPLINSIAITGYVTLENALECMKAGASNFIFKPLEELSELEEAVADASRKIRNWRNKLRELRGMKPKE